jgi:hypothetical protein
VLEYYETQSDQEGVAEDEASYESTRSTFVEVPVDLVPSVRRLLARKKAVRKRHSKPKSVRAKVRAK